MIPAIQQRPDGRSFLSLEDFDLPRDRERLAAFLQSHGTTLHCRVNADDEPLVQACETAGFRSEVTARSYAVPFSSFVARPIAAPAGVQIVGADEVNPDRLFRLDETLRQDVPGVEGWIGNRAWFDDELASTAFDATGYLVAVEPAGSPVGLIRFWRNDDGPRLGLLGVLPHRRTGSVASALLYAGACGASQWGHTIFRTETARPALQRRVERYGGQHTATFLQMVAHPSRTNPEPESVTN